MKKTSLWCLLCLLSLANAAWPQGKAVEKAVAALEQKWLEAQKASNPDLLAPLLSSDFVNTSTEGKVTGKAETLADTKATKWDSAGYDSVKVTAFGNTAIATGVFNGKGTDAKGKHLELHERWTDTWVKMRGQWQCVASHGSERQNIMSPNRFNCAVGRNATKCKGVWGPQKNAAYSVVVSTARSVAYTIVRTSPLEE